MLAALTAPLYYYVPQKIDFELKHKSMQGYYLLQTALDEDLIFIMIKWFR